MPWAISCFAGMYHFSFRQHFNLIHVSSQSSLKIHLAMSSLPSFSLKLHLELSFLPSSLYIHPHFSPSNIAMSPGLTIKKSCCTWIRILLHQALLWILDCTLPPGHTRPPPEHTLPCNLDCPSTDDLASRAIHHFENPFLLCNKELLNSSFWEHT